MRRTFWRSLTLAGCLVCVVAATAGADHRTYQTSNIFQAGNPSNQLGGAATLFRSKQGLEMRIATSGLSENSAFTVWWVIFNNPAACTGRCGADDLGNPAVRASVFYAAGFVTGGDGLGTEDGTGNVSAQLEAGALAQGIDVEVGSGLEPGNGYGAEVHLVVRSHGTIDPGHVHEQIGSFNGGCNPTCGNRQAAVFLPVE